MIRDMNKLRSLFVVAAMALVLSGCGSSAVGPNAQLPEAKAGSTGCEKMEEVLQDQMLHTQVGKDFIAATEKSAPEGDPAAQDARHSQVQQSWDAFIAQLNQPQVLEKFRQAGQGDQLATQAVQALEDYYQASSKLNSGEVPQYEDPAAATEELSAGGNPTPNPEFERLADLLVSSHETLTKCMPSWPVVF